MKVAQAEETPATLVGIDDTQQIRHIGPDVAEHATVGGGGDRTMFWAVVAAVALAAGALGVAFIALVSAPDAVAGPQGPTGLQGATGPQGVQGAPGPEGSTGPQGAAGPRGATGLTGSQGSAGPQGATGARGPAGATGAAGASGTIASSTAVAGTPALSTVGAPVGSTVTASATCPQGEVALGGGAQVTASGTSAKDVVLRSSFPTSTNGWRATGSVIAPLGSTDQMSVRPYVLCGKPSQP